MGVGAGGRKPSGGRLGKAGQSGEKARMENRADRITSLLTAAFAPLALEVVDDSAQHAGHSGARPGGETHFSVLLVSAGFEGHGRLARSRAVHAVLATELAGGLHALALKLLTPAEAGRG